MEWAGAGAGCKEWDNHPDMDSSRIIVHDNIPCGAGTRTAYGHANACASIMMANSHNDHGMVGACPGCGLYFFPIESTYYSIPGGMTYEEILEAAVDNGKYGLLGEWNYNRESVILNLFKYY